MLNLVKMLLLHIGSYDFKFQNNSGNDIKLTFNVTSDNVTATIYKLQ